jgi:hypothetical protein
MFRRHTHKPFPVRNIIALLAIALIVLLFIAQQLKKAKTEAAEPTPPIIIEGSK